MPDVPAGSFVCYLCGEVFPLAVDPSVPLDELRKNFGDIPIEECEQVCDDCYEMVTGFEAV